MAKKNRFKDVQNLIIKAVNDQKVKAFTEKALYILYEGCQQEWNLPYSKSGRDFVKYLASEKLLIRKDFNDEEGRIKTLYHLPNADDYSIYMGFKKNSYYTHYTAMYLNNLTLQIPKTNYLNFEHYDKMTGDPVTQKRIDEALSKPQRKSNKYYQGAGIRITMLNGQFTGRLGVENQEENQQYFAYTDLERTLIDISIRPVYAGGIFEVLEAYREAKGRLKIQKLKEYLGKLELVYPYQQAIGFYLEKAGYSKQDQEEFKGEQEFTFYLTYNLKQKDFSEKWKLWYPKGM